MSGESRLSGSMGKAGSIFLSYFISGHFRVFLTQIPHLLPIAAGKEADPKRNLSKYAGSIKKINIHFCDIRHVVHANPILVQRTCFKCNPSSCFGEMEFQDFYEEVRDS